MTTTSEASASNKEKFDVLYESGKNWFWKSIEFEFKEYLILIAIAGWIITVQRAQELFTTSPVIRVTATVILLLLTALHTLCVVWIYRSSSHVQQQLQDLDYMPPEICRSIRIPSYLAVSYCCMHLAATIATIIILWSLH